MTTNAINGPELAVGSRVTIIWKETSDQFAGSIQSVNADGTIDVLYDELVNDKRCIERDITPSRVVPMADDDYWVDCLSSDEEGEVPPMSIDGLDTPTDRRSKDNLKLTTHNEQSRLIVRLLNATIPQDQITRAVTTSATESISEVEDDLKLTNAEAMMLHDSLSNAKLMELLSTSAERVEWISSLFNLRIIRNLECDEIRKAEGDKSVESFITLWNQDGNTIDSTNKMVAWLKSVSHNDDSPIKTLCGSAISLAASIRLVAAANILQSRQNPAEVFEQRSEQTPVSAEFISTLNVPEDVALQILQLSLKFMEVNFLAPSSTPQHIRHAGNSDLSLSPSKSAGARSTGIGGKMVNQSKKSLKSKSGDYFPHAMSELGGKVFPVISSLLSALTVLLGEAKQSDRLLAIVSDLCLACIKLDPAAHPGIAALSAQRSGALTSLQHAASRLLRLVFARYDNHRHNIIMGSMNAILDAYAVKTPTKNFIIHYSAHTESVQHQFDQARRGKRPTRRNPKQNASTFALMNLLLCIQSTTNLSSFTTENMASFQLQQRDKSNKKKASTTARGDSVEDQIQTSRNAILDCHQSSAFFVVELLKRCVYKEASGEYRSVAMIIAEELVTILPMPDWPVVAIVVEQMILRFTSCLQNPEIVQQLNDAPDATVGGRKDSSLSVFLIDILTKLGSNLRELNIIAEKEFSATEDMQFTPNLKGVLRRKFLSMKPSWSLEDSNKFENKASASVTDSAQQTTLNAFSGLQILMDVSSAAMEIVADQPLHACYSRDETDIDDPRQLDEDSFLSDERWSIAGLVPTPLNILNQVGQQKDLLRLIPDLTTVDFFYHYLSSYILQKFSASLPTQSYTSISIMGTSERRWTDLGACMEICDDRLKDAYALLLVLWYQETLRSQRLGVAKYPLHALRALSYIEHGQIEKLTGMTVPPWNSLNNGLVNLFFERKLRRHDTNNFWAEHSCLIEESLAANRHIVNLRLLRVCYEKLLTDLLFKSTDPVPAVRARIVKSLSTLLLVDTNVLLREQVHSVVVNKLKDKAISVREEAVKLVGSFIMATGVDDTNDDRESGTVLVNDVNTALRLSEYYLEDIKYCLHDEGISVRKSVVGLFKDILLNQPSHPQFMQLCLSLLEKLSHPKEEDSIKEVIRSTLQQIFFLPPSSEQLLNSFNRKRRSPRKLLIDFAIDKTSDSVEKNIQTTPPCAADSHVQSETTIVEGVGIDVTKSSVKFSAKEDLTPSGAIPCGERQADESLTLSHKSKSPSMDSLLQWHVRNTALQLVEMASSNYEKSQQSVGGYENAVHEWLINLLREVLHGTNEGEELQRQAKQRRTLCFNYCQKVVDDLVEQLLRAEEQDVETLKFLEQKGGDSKDYIVELIGTISLFCEAHPPFIAGHLTTIIPYLKRDTSQSMANNSFISLRVTEILCSISVLDSIRIRFNTAEVLHDLTNIALNYSGKNVKAAVKCSALLTAHVGKDASYIFNLASKCFNSIYSIMKRRPERMSFMLQGNQQQRITFSVGEAGRLQRCLIVLAYFCEFAALCSSQLQEYVTIFNQKLIGEYMDAAHQLNSALEAGGQMNLEVAKLPVQQIPYLHPTAIYGSVYSAAVCILSTADDRSVQLQAVQAICGVFIGYPRLMILANETDVLPALLGNEFDARVHERFVLALKDMLMSEEAKLERNAALNLMKESGVPVTSVRDGVLGNPEHDSDTTIAGFQLQQHLDLILNFLCHKNASMRITTLQLIGTLLRQGMLCPLDVIGELVAVLCDSEEAIRCEALRMLQIEDEKRSTFLDNRLTEGVEKGFIQQCSIQIENFEQLTMVDILQIATIDAFDHNNMLSGTALSIVQTRHDRQLVSAFGALYVSCIQQVKRRRVEILYSLLRRCCTMFDSFNDKITENSCSYEAQRKGSDSANLEMSLIDRKHSDKDLNSNNKSSNKKKRLPRSNHKNNIATGITDYRVDIKKATQSLNVVYFLCTTVAFLPYTAVDEPLHVIFFINRTVPISTTLQLQRLKLQLLDMGCEFRKEGSMQPPVLGSHPTKQSSRVERDPLNKHGRDVVDADILVNEQNVRKWLHSIAHSNLYGLYVRLCELTLTLFKLRGYESLFRLKAFLKVVYQLSDDRCAAFSPDDKNNSAATDGNTLASLQDKLSDDCLPEYSAQATAVVSAVDLFSEKIHRAMLNSAKGTVSSELEILLMDFVRAACMDYNRISSLLTNDPEDFTYNGSTSKRQKRAPNRQSTGAVSAGRGRGRSRSDPSRVMENKTRKKRKRYTVDSDDEDEDDEDFLNGDDEDYIAPTGKRRNIGDGDATDSTVGKHNKRKAAVTAVANVRRFIEDAADVDRNTQQKFTEVTSSRHEMEEDESYF